MRQFKIKLFALPTYAQQPEAPTAQLAVARAASSIDTAEMLVLATAKETDLASRARVRPSLLDRAHMRMNLMRGIVEAREAVRELMSIAGSSAFSESIPLQRIWRYPEIASSHAVSNPSISAEVYGRLLLGCDGPTAILCDLKWVAPQIGNSYLPLAECGFAAITETPCDRDHFTHDYYTHHHQHIQGPRVYRCHGIGRRPRRGDHQRPDRLGRTK